MQSVIDDEPDAPQQHALLGLVALLQARSLHPQLHRVGQGGHAARQQRLGVLGGLRVGAGGMCKG